MGTDIGANIRRLREAQGWSQARLARETCRVAGISGDPIGRQEISRYEAGKRTPRDWLPFIAAALGVPAEELRASRKPAAPYLPTPLERIATRLDDIVEANGALMEPRSARQVLASRLGTADEPETLFQPGVTKDRRASLWQRRTNYAEDEVRRRVFLALMGTATAKRLAEEAEPVRLAFNDMLASEPTERDADEWDRVVYDYAHEVGVLPAPQLLGGLLCDFAEIKSLIDAAPRGVDKQLLRASAQLGALTAIAFINLGNSRDARRWWRTAARAADESNDPLIASLVRGRQAVFSLYGPRRMSSVIGLAEEAIEIGRNKPCTGVASGYAAKAQALAVGGRHAEAREALEDLARLIDRLPDEVQADRSSQWGWSAQRFHHVASHVYAYTGDVRRASDAQDAALASYPEKNYQGRSQIELYRATCFIRAGDADASAQHIIRTLERLPAECREDGLLHQTAFATLAMASPADAHRPAMREAYEMLATPGHQ